MAKRRKYKADQEMVDAKKFRLLEQELNVADQRLYENEDATEERRLLGRKEEILFSMLNLAEKWGWDYRVP